MWPEKEPQHLWINASYKIHHLLYCSCVQLNFSHVHNNNQLFIFTYVSSSGKLTGKIKGNRGTFSGTKTHQKHAKATNDNVQLVMSRKLIYSVSCVNVVL